MTVRHLVNLLVGLPPDMEVIFEDAQGEPVDLCPSATQVIFPEDDDDEGLMILSECDGSCGEDTTDNNEIIESIDTNPS